MENKLNWLQVRMYFRFRHYLAKLDSVKIKYALGLPPKADFRYDLLLTLQRIMGTIANCNVLIDIGANTGEFTHIFRHCNNLESIICIEPNEGLNNDIVRNNPIKNITILNYAISDENGEMDFYIHDDSQMSSLFSSDESLIKRDFQSDDYKKIYTKKCPVKTLDTALSGFMDQLKGKDIFLKIDTQGNEWEVLGGAKLVLPIVKYCLLEYMFQSPYTIKYSFEDIIDIMSKEGFKCKGPVYSAYRETSEPGAILFLFVKQ